MESVHLLPGRPQLHHFVPHLDDIGKTHFIQSLGQSHRVCRHIALFRTLLEHFTAGHARAAFQEHRTCYLPVHGSVDK